MYQILIADDHPLYREAIMGVITQAFPGTTLLEAKDLPSALEAVTQREDLDLVLLDLNMPGMDGLNGLIQIRNAAPDIPVAMISAEEDREVVLRAVTYGAVGFICKTTSRENIGNAINQILDGQVYLPSEIIRSNKPSGESRRNDTQTIDPKLLGSLTRRQLLVLERMAQGESNKQIAYELNIAETTVKTHVSAILSKLEVNNRMQAVLCASKINFDQYLHR